MRNLSSWYKLVFLQLFLALYISKNSLDSVFTYIVSYHICPPPLWVFKWSFFWRILCLTSFWVFFPRDEKKQGQSRQSLQMLKNKFKSCFGRAECSWPSREGCKVRYVLTGVSDCRAGWDLAAFTLRHMLLKPFPVPAYKICCKTFVHRKKT